MGYRFLADGVVAGDGTARTGALMLAESRRLERLVTDLLDLSRLGASEVHIDQRPTELRALVATAAAVWRDRCAREDVRLAVELPPGEVVATTDAGRVRQILDNLAENALRVTPADGLIVLALRAVDGAAAIQVRDSGPGLTPEDRAEAFEPGVLYERYRGVRPVSSGVGLALVGRLAQLAKKHGFTYNKVYIRSQKTRWGSCSHRNNISLNVNLVRLSEKLIDYTILHELVHTREKNHGQRFWQQLDVLVGDARALNRELRQYNVLLLSAWLNERASKQSSKKQLAAG